MRVVVISNMDKVILIDKPLGITSHDVLYKLKKKLNIKKIGHCGTLDPLASGLLVCVTGRATKLAQYAESGRKRYSGTILFGRQTTTDDLEGETILSSDKIPRIEDCQEIINKKYLGEVDQVPPHYSAIKINGRKAYEIARSGEIPKLTARKINMYSFEVSKENENEMRFVVECGSGTYIRSLARDLGAEFGCGACLSSLRREASYPFDINNAKTIEEVAEEDYQDWGILFPNAFRIALDDKECSLLCNGNQEVLDSIYKEYSSDINSLEKVVFSSKSTNKDLGLLLNNGKSLKFGFVSVL